MCAYVQIHMLECVCVRLYVFWLIKNVLRINIIALGIQLND